MTHFDALKTAPLLAVLVGSALLTACGGGGGGTGAAAPQVAAQTPPADPNVVTAATGPRLPVPPSQTPPPQPTPVTPPSPVTPPATGAVTGVRFESTSASAQADVPVTFGQAFADGDLAATDSLSGTLDDGTVVPLQVDVKASYADRSVRHAVISAILPALAAGKTVSMSLMKSGTASGAAGTGSPAQLLASGFAATVSLTIDGQLYTASAADLLQAGAGARWLKGSIVNEWTLAAPLRTAAGVAHPHLTARFDVRAYEGRNKAKVDVVIENAWAYQAAPGNFTYDAQIAVAGQPLYTSAALKHYHHARWKKTIWWGGEPALAVKLNTAYLIASKAVPNYDQSVTPSAAQTAAWRLISDGVKGGPMQSGIATPAMPDTGGRPDIGLLPAWSVAYLLSMDKDARAVMMKAGDLAGSWSVHYRDAASDRPASLVDHPYMSLLANPGDMINPATGRSEAFPACVDCASPLIADSSHQPNFAYLPYLVSGDRYYLDELQFYASFNLLQYTPAYRDFGRGLVKSDQTRGQAWVLRSLAEAAAITPDADPLKAQFETFLSNNLDYFNATFSNNPSGDNALGALVDVHAVIYDNYRGVAPWQDDFFTAAAGRVLELGFAKAQPLLRWKSTFPVGRMRDPGFCWISASVYQLIVRDTASSPIYTSFAQAYRASQLPEVTATACASAAMAAALNLKAGEMVGYASSPEGYPANMQPALAYSVGSGNPDAAAAWALFQARANKPDYAAEGQFNIVPR